MRLLILTVLSAMTVFGQPTVAPANAPVGKPRGEELGGYNYTNSFETGYRFRSVGGNLGKYRSDVNFGNGVRLLGSNFTMHSKEGHGSYFDELLLNTQGLGNDPYQYSSFRVQKNRLYRYDALWRQNDYYNPALPIAAGLHFLDTTRRLQDHSVVLLPQSPFKLFLGYSRNGQSGPGLSTVQLFDSRGDEFPLFQNVRRLQNEYRLGAEAQLMGIQLSFLRTWEYFKDDTRKTSSSFAGNNALDPTTLTSLRRDEPYHGTTKGWRVNLRSDRSKLVALNGRFTYAGGRRNFIFDENAMGTDRFGTGRNRQLLLFGNARRPVTTAALTATIFPGERFSLINHTSFHHTRMDGDANSGIEQCHAWNRLPSVQLPWDSYDWEYDGSEFQLDRPAPPHRRLSLLHSKDSIGGAANVRRHPGGGICRAEQQSSLRAFRNKPPACKATHDCAGRRSRTGRPADLPDQ
ncbi:MAG: hypothetical protein WKF37_14935 [Bryobacteraceae bacterium]